MRFLMRALGGFTFVVLVLAAVAGAWGAWRWSQSEADDKALDDPKHLAAKHSYLQTIARDFGPGGSRHDETKARPNIVVILFDDMGWGDIGAYGNQSIATPTMDGLAAEGARFTEYFAPAPYCTPSRAGLLTGRLPVRTNLTQVTFPKGSPLNMVMRIGGAGQRLPRHEITVPEVLGAAGYRTAMIGKWHLGVGQGAEPNDFGFERYFGVLHSNDMSPLPLYRDREIVEAHPIDQTTLTARYTDEAAKAITDFSASGKPFFLYFAHTFPHIPLYAPEEKRGQSKAGLYGDVVEELDRSVAGVMAALERAGVADNTLVIITSDNGPWYEGSPGDVRGRKNETFEGGQRVPLIIHWPGRVAGGQVVSGLSMGTDLMPTLLNMLGLPQPDDRVLDGKDVAGHWFDGAPSPHEEIWLNRADQIQAIRTHDYKLRDKAPVYGGTTVGPALAYAPPMGPMLFNLTRDPYEAYDASDHEPMVRESLEAQLRAKQKEIADNPFGWRN